jgi:uncharacterized protein YxjI
MMSELVPNPTTAIATFAKADRLSVRQRKNWIEILTSFDARNKYVVYNELGEPVMNVEEQGSGFGSFVKRLILQSMRPFETKIEDLTTGGTHLLTLNKPFRFIFHRIEVRDPSGTLLGAIQWKWSWLRRRYLVVGPDGREVATLFGPILKPWTFQIQLPGSTQQVGVIQKKWSGLLKEAFSDADNFWVAYESIEDPQLRALLFAATVLIDIVHFEHGGWVGQV